MALFPAGRPEISAVKATMPEATCAIEPAVLAPRRAAARRGGVLSVAVALMVVVDFVCVLTRPVELTIGPLLIALGARPTVRPSKVGIVVAESDVVTTIVVRELPVSFAAFVAVKVTE